MIGIETSGVRVRSKIEVSFTWQTLLMTYQHSVIYLCIRKRFSFVVWITLNCTY